jgi:sucrose-6-phosphate hydrolase SacC (GH32 family)
MVMNRIKKIYLLVAVVFGIITVTCCNQRNTKSNKVVSQATMEKIYNEVKTPFKYGIVLQHPDSTGKVDCPTIFRKNGVWYMTYIAFNGQGYETWLAESDDLLNWESKGKILSFTENTWDANQKGGYVSLINIDWGGDYSVEKYKGNYWMTYIGGHTSGYEAGVLKIGLANSTTLTEVHEWNTYNSPLLSPEDEDVRWFENNQIYKSLVIRDSKKHTGHPFVMYYNAKGVANFESIGMAVSNDMVSWERYGNNPVITKGEGICGDAQIAKYNDLYIMFYFGAFWKPNGFDRFACSYDLITWTDWNGPDLTAPSEDYDKIFAHKPWVIKWNGVVYHFYNAVGNSGRVIALATSKDLKQN